MHPSIRRLLAVTLAIYASLAIITAGHAQTPSITVTYPAGLNMVGGPPGTSFAAARTLYTYSSGSYQVAIPSTATAGCQGYWADFPASTTVRLPLAIGPVVDCPLQPGYNLVGNPFSGPAYLPGGTTAYFWSPGRQAYDTVGLIPPGGAVWIYSASASTIELDYAPHVGQGNATITINGFVNPGPFTVHVGDTIKLLVPSNTPYQATADPTYLHLDSAGTFGDITCIGDPSCTPVTFLDNFWLWTAIQPGSTMIIANPVCPAGNVPCISAEQEITINILP